MNNSNIERVEPLSWWIGMKTPLQIMIYGQNIGDCQVTVDGEKVKVTDVRRVENPNYLFVDVEISGDAAEGEYRFRLNNAQGEAWFDYRLDRRREGSAVRQSFDSSDLVYLIMPDRFSCGDESILTTDDTTENIDRKNPAARHGGDLQGIIDHLDYIADLGVTTLWVAPFQLDDQGEQSYHGYACSDYYKTDPRYGTNEKYRELVERAHEKGMKVIMDVVLNHCATTHWWMKDLPMRDWIHEHGEFVRSTYRLASITDPHASRGDLRQTIDGWFDNTMPDIALENPYVLQYLLQAYIWWVEWADLDGLRVDTFPYNDRTASAQWTKRTLEEYPNLRIVAECWHSSQAVVAYWDGGAVNHDGYTSHLPSVMDFPLQEALGKALSDPSDDWAGGMNAVYESLALDFLYKNPRTLLVFLDNHDIGRFADTVNGNTAMIKIGLTVLATVRGIPQLYYGTEWGFRSADPEGGDAAARIDFPGGWNGDERNLFTGEGCSDDEREIYDHARLLFNWRKTSPVVHTGRTTHYLPYSGTYSYVRHSEQGKVLVVVNPTQKEFGIDWQRYTDHIEPSGSARDVITGQTIKFGEPYSLTPQSSLVLEVD